MKKRNMALLLGLGLVLTGCNKETTVTTTTSPAAVTESQEATTTAAVESNTSEAGIAFYQVYENPDLLKDFVEADIDFKTLIASEDSVSVYYLNDPYKETDTTYAKYIYPIASKEESSALYLNFVNDKLESAKIDEFSGSVNHTDVKADFAITHFGYNLKLQPKQESFKFNYDNLESINKELDDKFIGKEESKLTEYLKVNAPATVMENLKSGKINNVYLLVNELGYTTSVTVNVVAENNLITDIHVDDAGNRTFDPISLIK